MLNLICHVVAGPFIFLRSSCKVSIFYCESISLLSFVLLGYTEIELFILTSLSFMYKLICPKTEPWGTPLTIPDHSLDKLSITILWTHSWHVVICVIIVNGTLVSLALF